MKKGKEGKGKAEMEGKIPRSAERPGTEGWKLGKVRGMLSIHHPSLPHPDLTVLAVLSWPFDQPLLSPFPHGPFGLGKGLLEGVLFRVHLIIQELCRQLSAVVDLNLHRETGFVTIRKVNTMEWRYRRCKDKGTTQMEMVLQ